MGGVHWRGVAASCGRPRRRIAPAASNPP
jgi:hypothetical protein